MKRTSLFLIIKTSDSQYLTKEGEMHDEVYKAELFELGTEGAALRVWEKAQKWPGADVFLLFPNGYQVQINPFGLRNYMKVPTCQAEDQGGWPCCSELATWYVAEKDSIGRGKEDYYCDYHRENNRFYRPDQMRKIP